MNDLLNDLEQAPPLASLRKRWIAALIDYLLLFVIFFALTFYLGEPETDLEGNTSYHLSGLPALIVMTVPWFVLFPLMESLLKGKTIGKTICSIKAVREDGAAASFKDYFLRHLVDFLDILPVFGVVGILTASNNQNKQRLGDKLGHTIVVNA